MASVGVDLLAAGMVLQQVLETYIRSAVNSARQAKEAHVLRSTKAMLDYSVVATDGAMGLVSDIVVDDLTLELRYVVVDTGTWPSGGRVLLANWIDSVQPERKTIVVCIEKKRIQEPPICA
jgi:hypothetical protein